MRTLLLGLLAAACCGRPPAAPPPADVRKVQPGRTTGLEGTDWGMRPADMIGAHAGGALQLVTPIVVEDQAGTATYRFERDRLVGIEVSFDTSYPSMDACAGDFAATRARLDGRFGPSRTENLAAYWTTGVSEVELACNPTAGDAGAALSLSFAPRRETPGAGD